MLINITQTAQNYLSELLNEQNNNHKLKIELSYPGTSAADIAFVFCSETQKSDFKIKFSEFSIYFEASAAKYLVDAKIDYIDEQITIKAPNLRPTLDSSMDDIPNPDKTTKSKETKTNKKRKEPKLTQVQLIEIQYFIEQEINPSLEAHGGKAQATAFDEDAMVHIEFHGGCQGCGMSAMTLEQGIKTKLMENFNFIKGVIDNTAHSEGLNPFY